MTNHSRRDRFAVQDLSAVAFAAAGAPATGLPGGRRNFMIDGPQTDPAKLYAGTGDLGTTLGQMEPVAARLVEDAHLTDLGAGSMPAGYTFLAQLLAHEVAATTPDAGTAATTGLDARARQQGLMLDSIFGAVGADTPVTRFHQFFRFRPSASDPGRQASVDVVWTNNHAELFDPRNADTPMLSQLSALFMLFCDHARSALLGRFTAAKATVLARCLTAEVFHAILRHDLLPRLLHPDVWSLYGQAAWAPVDAAGVRDGALVPVEFTNAAFRFGHAMVRSVYLLNDRSPALPLGDLTRGFPRLEQARAVNSNFWRVDWRLFFGEGPKVQMSRRIGPNVPPDLERLTEFFKAPTRFPTASSGKNDIALKDLARGAGAGLQRVAAIADALRPHLRAKPGLTQWALWDEASRAALVRDWLGAGPDAVPTHLLSDPPPYLFVLIEAGAKGTQQGFGGGKTLGALGSVLAAEVVLPRLRQAERVVAAQADLNEARRMVLGTDPVPNTMPAFIAYLSDLT